MEGICSRNGKILYSGITTLLEGMERKQKDQLYKTLKDIVSEEEKGGRITEYEVSILNKEIEQKVIYER